MFNPGDITVESSLMLTDKGRILNDTSIIGYIVYIEYTVCYI